jgi:acyl transferase domain-containing protein
MLAALATEDEVRGVLERHALDLAAHNAPDEWVLSGELVRICAAGRELPSARRLPVSGAWHGRSMAGAVTELEELIRALQPGPARARIICNATGEEVDGPRFLPSLAGQLTRVVRWAGSMESLAAAGVTDLVAVGPGHVLRGLARKNLGQRIRVHTTEDAEDLARTVELLRG